MGFWILVDNKEYFVPFDDCPVFKGASIRPFSRGNVYLQPKCIGRILDADTEMEALEQPEHYALVFK